MSLWHKIFAARSLPKSIVVYFFHLGTPGSGVRILTFSLRTEKRFSDLACQI